MKATALALGMVLVTGCAQMKVKVHIFDQNFATTTPFLKADVRDDQKRALALLANGGELEQLKKGCIDSAVGPIRDLQDAGIGAMDNSLEKRVKLIIEDRFEDVRKDYETFNDAADKALTEPSDKTPYEGAQHQDLLSALGLYAHAESKRRNLKRGVNDEIVARLKDLEPASPTKDQSEADRKKIVQEQVAVQTAIATTTTGIQKSWMAITGGPENSVFADSKASLIINAPSHAWRGLYNETYGLGSFGNTDIAVKMEGLADFTLKGVRVDSTKVTQATMAGITTAVKVVASAYGVPLPSSSGGGATQAQTKVAPDPEQQKLDAEQKLKSQRAAIVDILEAIGQESTALGAESAGAAHDAQRKAAVQRIKDVFAANRADLVPAQSVTGTATGSQ